MDGVSRSVKVKVTAEAKITCTYYDKTSTTTGCTGGMTNHAEVYIYNSGMPLGPQTVTICHGRTVTFYNVKSGPTWNITSVGLPAFPTVTLLNPSAVPRPGRWAVGAYE